MSVTIALEFKINSCAIKGLLSNTSNSSLYIYYNTNAIRKGFQFLIIYEISTINGAQTSMD